MDDQVFLVCEQSLNAIGEHKCLFVYLVGAQSEAETLNRFY